MYRSFTNRVLGGVCGGLGALLRINAWWLRAVFAVLSLATGGGFVLLYLALWLAIPQESLINRRGSGAGLFLLALVLIAAAAAGWIATLQGSLRGPGGEPLYMPALLLAVSVIFFVRQLRG